MAFVTIPPLPSLSRPSRAVSSTRRRRHPVLPTSCLRSSPAQQHHHAQTPVETIPATTTKSHKISHLRSTLNIPQEPCTGSQHVDPFWAIVQSEARSAADAEPLLASFLFATVLNHATLHSALAFHLANKLSSPSMPSTMLMTLFQTCMATPSYCTTLRRDLLAVMERDPACTRFIDALLYFKGFHALQSYRVAHMLWKQGRLSLAYHLQSQVSKELQVDIHPAASIGPGLFVDHATGIVIGETARIGTDVSLLHHVTLGGSGARHGKRHPNLGNGVLVGAGATILGDITVGDGCQIGACSLVLQNIPPNSTVVGVPAKVVKSAPLSSRSVVPSRDMKHERCLPGCKEDHEHIR